MDHTTLAKKRCIPCEGGTPPLRTDEIQPLLQTLSLPWDVKDNRRLEHTFVFEDFQEAMAFVHCVATAAEDKGHHPDIHIFYSRVIIELWTHAIGGLSENDFILAAAIEEHCAIHDQTKTDV